MFNLLLLSIGALIRLSVAVHCSPATGGVGAQVFSRLRPVCEIRVRGSWGRSIPEDNPVRNSFESPWQDGGGALVRQNSSLASGRVLSQSDREVSASVTSNCPHQLSGPSSIMHVRRALSGPCPPKSPYSVEATLYLGLHYRESRRFPSRIKF